MTTQISVTRKSLKDGLVLLHVLESQVKEHGACSLPGVSIDYDLLKPLIKRAVARGFVDNASADFVLHGLWFGFDLGIDTSVLRGKQRFRNYPTALESRPYVSKATRSRLEAQKSVCLGEWETWQRDVLPWEKWRIFPLGAVPKPLEPTEMRPVSDHTRTGLKDATDMTFLRHSLNAYDEIASYLKQGFFLRVGDVEGAFPLLPLAPRLWPFFLFHWWDVEAPDDDLHAKWCLYVHVCGDFGAAGLPGTWKVFFSDVIVGVARSEGVLTLPMVVYVDDTGTIAADQGQADREGVAFREFLKRLGIYMKELKERAAATLQLMLGFWWDSTTQTRTLEERKFVDYLAMLRDCVDKRSLTLRDMQRLAGRMQRALMTLPPGAACFLASLFALMRGLSLPWHQRRVSRATRRDFSAIKDLLELNLGRGYYSFDQFARAPAVYTDASKSRKYTGGGYVSLCGKYRWWKYGTAAAKHLIDTLEGDSFVLAVEDLGPGWRRCVVPCYIDNRAFGQSASKGWSRAERLGMLLKRLFALAVKYEVMYEIHWIASADNMFADALSREDSEDRFLELVREYELFSSMDVLCKHPDSGGIRKFGPEYSSDDAGDGPPGRGLPAGASAVPYSRASVFEGLPSRVVEERVDEILDSRLSASSLSSISAALSHWDKVRERHGWDVVIRSDDPLRGGKLATFVAYLAYESDLHANSIANYVWGLRAYMKFQRQLDPMFGIVEWEDFMQGMHVVAWVQSEPRKRVPLDLIKKALQGVQCEIFWEVQAAVLMLLLLFTFARSETPCPKSYTGEGALDASKHLLVKDVCIKQHNGAPYTAMRLKSIKQDARMERPEAAGGEDWIVVGDADGVFSLLTWLRRLFALHGGARDQDSAFFLDRERKRWLTYQNAMRDVRALWARVSSAAHASQFGLHSLRVSGYNAAKAGKKGVQLAVAQGGWMSAAHERYERFDMTDVMALTGEIAQQADLEGSSETLQRQSAVPANAACDNASPRPMRPVSRGSGSRRGVLRRLDASSPQASVLQLDESRDQEVPRVRERVEVWWDTPRLWYKGTIVAKRAKGMHEIVYDPHDELSRRKRTYVHDFMRERWRRVT